MPSQRRATLSPGLLEPMGRFIIDPVLRHRVREGEAGGVASATAIASRFGSTLGRPEWRRQTRLDGAPRSEWPLPTSAKRPNSGLFALLRGGLLESDYGLQGFPSSEPCS